MRYSLPLQKVVLASDEGVTRVEVALDQAFGGLGLIVDSFLAENLDLLMAFPAAHSHRVKENAPKIPITWTFHHHVDPLLNLLRVQDVAATCRVL